MIALSNTIGYNDRLLYILFEFKWLVRTLKHHINLNNGKISSKQDIMLI